MRPRLSVALGVAVGGLAVACSGGGGTAGTTSVPGPAATAPEVSPGASSPAAGAGDPTTESTGPGTDPAEPVTAPTAPGDTGEPATTAAVVWPPRPAGCPRFEDASTSAGGAPLGGAGDELREVSGMVASRTNPGLLWVHNDSGDAARIFLVGEDLAVRTTLRLAGVFALDWEAMAAGPGPAGEPWLWVADSGDNLGIRPFVEIHGIAEPRFGSGAPPTAVSGPVTTLRVRYPAGSTDVEAFAVDPRTGDGFLVTTSLDPAGRAQALRISGESLRSGGEVTAEPVASVAVTDGEYGARAADFSPDGSLLLVKDYRTTSVWLRGPDQAVEDLLAAEPVPPCTADLGPGEALAGSLDGTSVWTLEEGSGRPLRRFTLSA